jgi:hypothetical protein
MKIKILLSLFALGFGPWACVSSAPPPRPLDLPFSQVYPATFETVWAASAQVLDVYSITRIDRDAGLLETDWSEFRHNRALYDLPGQNDVLESVRYRIVVKLSKGIVAQTGDPAVRVQVLKELSENKNFVSDWERVPSDEIEEKVLLYRIGQRIRIAEALRRKSAGSKESLR